MQASRHKESNMYSLYNGGYSAFLYKKMYSVLHRTLLYSRSASRVAEICIPMLGFPPHCGSRLRPAPAAAQKASRAVAVCST